MNKFNKFLVNLFLLPKGLYKKMGCNIKQLEAILVLKLMMDDRRPSAFNQMKRNQKQKKEITNATLFGMIGSLMMGLFFLMFFIFDNDVSNFTIYFTSFCALLALTLISDFTNVLLDVRDNFIILPKPVGDRTFVLARLLHIIIHISKMIIPLSVPVLVFIGISKGFLGLIVLLPLLVLLTLFTVFLINAFYIFVLKITTPEKFKNIISYIQIAFAIGIYAASQILPRTIGKLGGNFNLEQYRFTKYFPTYWFAKCWNTLYTQQFDKAGIFSIAFTVLVPIVSIWVVVKYFAPSFNQKLSQISGSSSEGGNTKVSKENTNKKQYSNWWAKRIAKTSTEKMGFIFTWKMMNRSRDFKMKVYPGIGYLIVLIFIMFWQNSNTSLSQIGKAIHDQTGSGKIAFILIIYLSSILISSALGGIIMSDKYKAAWLYFITPVYKPGQIIAGAVKAITVMFFVPLAILAIVLGIGIAGINILPNVILAISNQLLIITLIAMVSINYLPFSTSVYKPNFTSVLKNFAMLMLAGLVGVLHYVIYNYMWIVLPMIALSLTATYLLFKSIGNYSCNKIVSVYRED